MHITRIEGRGNKPDAAVKKDKRNRKPRQKLQLLAEALNDAETYRLVYQRIHDHIGERPRDLTCNCSHDSAVIVSLEQLADYSEEHYSLVRPFKLGKPAEAPGKLVFDSRFESGNLMLAYESLEVPWEYRLLLQNDTNTRGYNQWFYFSVENMRAGQSYTLRLCNFVRDGLIEARKRNIRCSLKACGRLCFR